MRQAKAERKTVEINVAKESLQMLPLMEEILHQLIGSLSHYLQGFIHPRWCRISSINSIAGDSLFFPPSILLLGCTSQRFVFWVRPSQEYDEIVKYTSRSLTKLHNKKLTLEYLRTLGRISGQIAMMKHPTYPP